MLWGILPQAPGIYRFSANPSQMKSPTGFSVLLNPSLVLAPESALGFHPWIALSSAPAARSVSRIVIMSNKRTKKGIDFSSAFRHGRHMAAFQRLRHTLARRNQD